MFLHLRRNWTQHPRPQAARTVALWAARTEVLTPPPKAPAFQLNPAPALRPEASPKLACSLISDHVLRATKCSWLQVKPSRTLAFHHLFFSMACGFPVLDRNKHRQASSEALTSAEVRMRVLWPPGRSPSFQHPPSLGLHQLSGQGYIDVECGTLVVLAFASGA